jgi:hypothetical protein
MFYSVENRKIHFQKAFITAFLVEHGNRRRNNIYIGSCRFPSLAIESFMRIMEICDEFRIVQSSVSILGWDDQLGWLAKGRKPNS